MSNQESLCTNQHDSESNHDSNSDNDARKIKAESQVDVSRVAQMVACGEMQTPLHWPPDLLHRLLDEVHRIRRGRLVRFIARSIASDIYREERREDK